MSPPTEQLIRDYLNRLSVAARDRLGADDRRALVDRTRKLIERKSDFAGRPTTLEVGRVLARLGDPAALVDQELRRLAAVRGGAAGGPGSPAPLMSAGSSGLAQAEDRAGWGSRGFLDRVFRREPRMVREEDRGWPAEAAVEAESAPMAAAPGELSNVKATVADGSPSPPTAPPPLSGAAPGKTKEFPVPGEESSGGAASERTAQLPVAGEPSGAAASGKTSALPVPGESSGGAASERTAQLPVAGQPSGASGDTQPPTAAPQGTAPLPRRERNPATESSEGTAAARGTIPRLSHWPSAAMNGRRDATRQFNRDSVHPYSNGTVVGRDQVSGPGGGEPDDQVGTAGPSEPDLSNETGGRSVTGAEARQLLASVVSWAMRQPLEATAVILLGVGGGIYPPFFLLGALVAAGSRLWDHRDKWAGLILPLVLTVIGAAIGLAVGGRSHGLHEGWVFLNVVSRMAAVLGAGYLAWRSAHGRRPPPVPPWNRSDRAT